MTEDSERSQTPLAQGNQTFKDLPVGAYFVWKRDCHLGPLLKANDREAMDDSDRVYRVAQDEEILT